MRYTERIQLVDAVEDPRIAELINENKVAVGGIRCDLNALITLERLEKFFCWTIKNDGDTVGYCAMVLDNGVATQLALFVSERKRDGCVARHALAEVDKDLIELGATRIIRQVRGSHRGKGYIHGLGYEELETAYVLNVGG